MSTSTAADYSHQPDTRTDTPSLLNVTIFGAGRVGSALGQISVKTGHSVTFVGSKSPEDLELLVDIMVPGATVADAESAVARADLVVMAVPLSKFRSINAQLFAGKTVIDVSNYWAPVDGELPEFAASTKGTSEVVAEYFADASVVKAFNHIGYHNLLEPVLADGSARAVALASNSDSALELVDSYVRSLGFDAVNVGPLHEGRRFQADTAVFGMDLNTNQLRSVLDLSDNPTSRD